MAAKPKKSNARAANLPVPQSREAAAAALHEIGMQQRQLARIEADMNDAIAQATKVAEAESRGLRECIEALTEGLRVWADANRAALTGDGKRKFADLGTGRIEWRLAPPSVKISKVKEVIERIRARGLVSFLREKTEIDKEAMLSDPERARAIPGVTIGSAGESFSVEPFEAEIQGAE